MNRWQSVLLGVSLMLLCTLPVLAGDIVISRDTVESGLRDKGVGWLKGEAKKAGKDWVFSTGQSETMKSIMDLATQVTTDEISQPSQAGGGVCRAVVMSEASQILKDLQFKNTAKDVGLTAFDTLTKIGGLAAGGLGAAAEGGGLAWLGKQYADAAVGKASDTVMDAIRKAFEKEKKPEFEVYEQSGTNSEGPYTVRAVWDIVGGSYDVYILTDRKCHSGLSTQGSIGVGKWWVTVSGAMLLEIDQQKMTAKFVPNPSKHDVVWDAECGCSKKELRPAIFRKVVKINPGGVTESGGGGTNMPPPPPPIPPKGRKVSAKCSDCQNIQDQIDTDTDALADADRENHDAIRRVQEAQARLESQQGNLRQKKASPGSIDISEEQIGEKIGAAKADIASAQAEADKAAAEMVRLKNELRNLGVKLDACIKKCEEHASMNKELKHSLIKFGLEKALDKHKKDDQQDDNVKYDDQHNNDDPYH